MQACRLYILGASGSGTTTLGRAIADAWSVPHADSDDYFWMPTNPPYTQQRPAARRVELMLEIFAKRPAWVLSGGINGWGERILQRCDAVVFLSLDAPQRLQRIKRREAVRRVGEEVDTEAFGEFLAWASHYDDPDFQGRSRVRHDAWLNTLELPVLRLDSSRSVQELRDAVLSWEPDSQRGE
ncbi:hypothetical protein [Arthrobacter sp. NIO-1057]|uniref:hypothetical protein n=1 Tax=Arthrobacter sp. NIO-1057 TaxID=993071 RepID=UPI00071C505C|nr:hypothetical protein [Arthrobacter sp. NIO-1057]KSU64234.1 hypothetical protein AS038_15890 [Arthrobacter sp. NIO-1057]SCC52013.1 Adenylate kinase [Arthrobacter sp. NIO-1057]